MQPVLGEDLPKLLTGNELMLYFAGLNDTYGYYAEVERLPMFEELCENIDDNIFSKTCMNSSHVLHSMLPPQSAASQH